MASSRVDNSSDDATYETIGDKHDVHYYASLLPGVASHTNQTNLLLGSEEYVQREKFKGTISSTQTGRTTVAGIVAKSKEQRMELSQVYKEVTDFYQRFSTRINLQEQYPNRIEKVDGYIRDLQEKEWFIVVAGDVGSGKSSLLNLLIGQEIFPCSERPCTSAICFLYNSDRRTMDVTYDDHQTESYSANNLQTLQQHLKKLSGQKRKKGQRTCQKINIYWPVPVLPKNVVLVEVPSVGENPERDQIALEHILKALVCIYVVLSTKAGGIQTHKRQCQSTLSALLFMCWDKVRAKEEEGKVWNNMLKELKSCTSNLNEDNVVKISVEKAAQQVRKRLLEKDDFEGFKDMVGRFHRLLKDSSYAKTSHHYSIIATMLMETHECLTNRRHFAALKGGEKSKELDRIQNELSTIRRQSEEFKTDIRAYMDREFEAIVLRLHDFLHLEETKERLLNCKDEADPPEHVLLSDKTSFDNFTKQRATAKLEKVIDEWEENFKMIDGVQKETQSRVQAFVGQIFKRMEEINLTLDSGYENARTNLVRYPRRVIMVGEQDEDVDMDTSLPVEGKILLGVTAPIWIPLGLAAGIVGLVVGTPIAIGVSAVKRAIAAGRYYNNEYQHTVHLQMKTIIKNCLTKTNLRAYLLQKCFLTFRKEVESLIDQNVSKSNTAKTRELQIIQQDQRNSEQVLEDIQEAKSHLGLIVRRFDKHKLEYAPNDQTVLPKRPAHNIHPL